MSSPDKAIPFKEGQEFAKLKEELLASGDFFVDALFPAKQESIGCDFGQEIVWMRPHDIALGMADSPDQPEFMVGGASRHDINQGRLGNCWLMAGIAALCENDLLFSRVVIHEQGFIKGEGYCGLFRFRFWRFGEWNEVVIDDFLPTIDGDPIFLQSQGSSKNEFWPALFEKAYAKVHGSYAALKGGQPIVAMRDFTGGVTESYNLKKLPEDIDIHEVIKAAQEKKALIGCGINPLKGRSGESTLACGLIAGHAYTITEANEVNNTKLLRIRNPHGGRVVEWNGAWSDDCRFQVVDGDLPEGWKMVTSEVVQENLQTIYKIVGGCNGDLVGLEDGCAAVGDPESIEEKGFTSWNVCSFGSGDAFYFGANPDANPEQKLAYVRGSEEWNAIDDDVKEKMGLSLESDGEFWMSLDDFCKYYDDIQEIERVTSLNMRMAAVDGDT